MKRRQSFSRIIGGLLSAAGLAVVNTCYLIADHFSTYAWPSYPKESSLRSHLLGSKHKYSREYIDSLSFEEIRALHDKFHKDQGGKPPSSSRLWMNKSYKKPQVPPPPPEHQAELSDVEVTRRDY